MHVPKSSATIINSQNIPNYLENDSAGIILPFAISTKISRGNFAVERFEFQQCLHLLETSPKRSLLFAPV